MEVFPHFKKKTKYNFATYSNTRDIVKMDQLFNVIYFAKLILKALKVWKIQPRKNT